MIKSHACSTGINFEGLHLLEVADLYTRAKMLRIVIHYWLHGVSY